MRARLERNKTRALSTKWAGTLCAGGDPIALEDVTGIYWDIPLRVADEATAAITGVLCTLDVRWVNYPPAVAADSWTRRLHRGTMLFGANPSLITNDEGAVRQFIAEAGGSVSSKSLLDGRRESFKVTNRPRKGRYLYTKPVSVERVIHFFVVGEQVFGLAVFEGRETVFDVPEDVRFTLSGYAKVGGLVYSTVTFSAPKIRELTTFLGSDALGDWASYADRPGLPIAAAIVDLLCPADEAP
ncbi:hypothetical protein [Fodinicola feengrottensis]|uniref:Uncharacterized protein n=1 Tax=Fodinicola feengrottensis TaxID=435914 RepID=A0ABP4T7A0_9ACTN|nr:hypothetical protein [Fodinicola feengrottensis]